MSKSKYYTYIIYIKYIFIYKLYIYKFTFKMFYIISNTFFKLFFFKTSRLHMFVKKKNGMTHTVVTNF